MRELTKEDITRKIDQAYELAGCASAGFSIPARWLKEVERLKEELKIINLQ